MSTRNSELCIQQFDWIIKLLYAHDLSNLHVEEHYPYLYFNRVVDLDDFE